MQIESYFTPPTLAGQKLIPPEWRVFCFATQGLSCEEIADELLVTAGAVHSLLRSVYRKCGVRNRAELLSVLLRQERKAREREAREREAREREAREREAQELLVTGIAIAGEVA